MATELFHPRDCLIDRLRVPPAACTRRRYNNCNSRFNQRPVRLEQRKRFGSTQVDRSVSWRSRSAEDLKSVRNNMMKEKVTILRRGESFDWTMAERNGRVMATGQCVDRIVGLRSDMYAGSGFAVSPSPSSLPLPSFSKKKQILSVDDSASQNLRRLLGLDI